MAEARKLYAGVKLREIRGRIGLTQAEYASKLGISLSYLNQMENNHRPLSARVMLALAQEFGLDVTELAAGSAERTVADMREALADPVFGATPLPLADLQLVASNAPNLARAFLGLYRAHRETQERLDQLNDALGLEERPLQPLPWEEVRDFFHYCDNYIDPIDRAPSISARDPFGRLRAVVPGEFAEHLSIRSVRRPSPLGGRAQAQVVLLADDLLGRIQRRLVEVVRGVDQGGQEHFPRQVQAFVGAPHRRLDAGIGAGVQHVLDAGDVVALDQVVADHQHPRQHDRFRAPGLDRVAPLHLGLETLHRREDGVAGLRAVLGLGDAAEGLDRILVGVDPEAGLAEGPPVLVDLLDPVLADQDRRADREAQPGEGLAGGAPGLGVEQRH
ncbi:hypothetical protein CNY89_02945, partial [Amaricoccus sp. HAR-UPW-R2A-40]